MPIRESTRAQGLATKGFTGLVAFATATILAPGASAQQESDVVAIGRFAGDTHVHRDALVRVSSAQDYTLGLRADGTLVAWGSSDKGQCRVPTPGAGLSFVEFDAGVQHALAVRSNGSAVGWGRNDVGQCNVPSLPVGVVYTKVSAGDAHSLALRSNGTVVGFGSNSNGQCTPPALPAGLTYTGIAAGFLHSLALRSDGSVVAFGSNAAGERNVPAFPAGVTAVRVFAGRYASAALLSNGAILQWGINTVGQANVPALPAGLAYVDLALGTNHSVALRSDGKIVAWGSDNEQQVSAAPASANLAFAQVECGASHSLVRLSNGSLQYWGGNKLWQANIPPAPAGRRYAQVLSAGNWQLPSSYGLLDDGSVVAWGTVVPPPTLPAGVVFTKLASSSRVACGLRSDGSAEVWWDCASIPCGTYAPPSGVAYVDVAAGLGSSVLAFLRDDGQVDVLNGFGNTLPPPPPLPPGVTYVEVVLGAVAGVALRSDGQVEPWGENLFGQFVVPPLPAGTTYVDVAAGYDRCYALRSDGVVVGWGNAPCTPATGTSPVIELLGGDYQVVARHADGTLTLCGENFVGEGDVPPLAAGHAWSFAGPQNNELILIHETSSGLPYCTAKTSSLGCLPQIAGSGFMSATQSSGYVVTTSALLNNRPGLLLYTDAGRAAQPFAGGTLCLAAPLRRTPGGTSGGNPPPANDCSGSFAIDLNAFRAGTLGGNPAAFLSVPGTLVRAQYWGRDNGFPAPDNAQLSGGLEFLVLP